MKQDLPPISQEEEDLLAFLAKAIVDISIKEVIDKRGPKEQTTGNSDDTSIK